jgi:hypothetical protein
MPFELPNPNSPVEMETRKTVVTSDSDAGLRVALRKSKAFRFATLVFNRRTLEEVQTVRAEWATLFPGLTFAWTNTDCDIDADQFYFDSPIKTQPDGLNSISYSMVLKAKLPISHAVPGSNVLPFVPTFGYEVEESKVILVSDAPSLTRKAAERAPERREFKLGFKGRQLAQLLTMEAFWDYHYPGKQITLHADLTAPNLRSGSPQQLHLDGNFWITSNLKWSVYGATIDYSFDIKEV